MAKGSSKSASRSVVPRNDVALCEQRIQKAYRVPDLQPKATGPWTREHEKLAWNDAGTGLACIVRRMEKGYLAAFVAVGSGHPLYGYSAEAIPAGLLRTHGRINYAQACDDRGPEDRSICHVHSGNVENRDDAWWIGMSCDGIGDLIPDDRSHAVEARNLGIDQVYRDERYAVDLCTALAHDLAVAGEPR